MRFIKSLLSTRVSLLLLISFAVSMAAATFIENDHGTSVARSLVYEAWWFELIMVWLAINFIAHIGQYKLFRRNRWPIGLFHLAFVLIIIGAGVTRYFGHEGVIHIREGQTQQTYFSSERFLQFRESHGSKKYEKPVRLIAYGFRPVENEIDLEGQKFKVVISEFIANGKQSITKGNETYIDVAIAVGEGREDHLVAMGNSIQMGNLLLGTGSESEAPVKVFKTDSGWMVRSNVHMQVMEMATQKIGALHANQSSPLQMRSLYQWDNGAFMVKSVHENSSLLYEAEKDKKQAKNFPDVVKLQVFDASGKLISQAYTQLRTYDPQWHSFQYGKKNYLITYGPKPQLLPFKLQLRKFELERYPGSQSPSSYASQLQVIDSDRSFPYRVFMNNVLDHQGYRFYQSSFDTDEKGTVLSVNKDRPGTYLTYLGYFLLALGMFLTLFFKGSRFTILNKKLGSIRRKHAVAVIFLLGFLPVEGQVPGTIRIVPEDQAEAYGRLIVQDLDGRMKPLNTLANEIVRKLNGRSKLSIMDKQFTAEQFLLAVQMDPMTYARLPIIKIDKEKSRQVFDAMGIQPTERVSFQQFLDKDGNYVLHEMVEEANRLKPSERNEAHKELLKTDERFNIFYALLSGDFLRIFPNKKDKNNTWFTSQQSGQGFDEEDGRFVSNISALYLSGLRKGLEEGDWKSANDALEYMQIYQQHAGKKVYPSEHLIRAELLYNKLSLGSRLFGPFWLLGIILLAIGIISLFKSSCALSYSWTIGSVLTWIGFALFSFHLGLRWYIAQRPPWTDGFEMLVFVAWGVLLFGLLFSGKSRFTVPLSLLFSGTLLFVGFLDWLNPEITNLMPVLHSYWLKIHVAIIVSSYAPLALAAVLALLSLILIIFKPANPTSNWWISMQELSIVNELAITIGLFLLAIGTFLGGVWANESWGRYWAWDPKETWALISVIIYAFVLHLRLIPACRNPLVYNLASLWAFSSIIMTSFGVNYYLSGLHSYAAGDPVPIPQWVYWAFSVLLLISVGAIFQYRKLTDQSRDSLSV